MAIRDPVAPTGYDINYKLLKLCGTAGASVVLNGVYLTVIIGQVGPGLKARAGLKLLTAIDRILGQEG